MCAANSDFEAARGAPLLSASAAEEWVGRLAQPVAVTGGTGFVGSHLVDTLVAAGVETRVLVRDPAEPRWIRDLPLRWVAGSLDDGESLGELTRGAGTVFHLAGVVRADRSEDFDRGNRHGTAMLAAAVAAAAPGARLIHVSSLAAVGPAAQPSGVGPDATPRPVSDYGRSKLAAEQELAGCGVDNWTIVRPPAVYGPRDTDVLEFFKMAVRGLFVLPAGERWISVVYVADVVRAVLAAAAAAALPRRVLHLGHPDPLQLEELLAVLAARGGYRPRFLRVPAPAVRAAGWASAALRRLGWGGAALTRDKVREVLARHWTTNSAASLAALGLDRGVAFDEGVTATWQWYRRQEWLPELK